MSKRLLLQFGLLLLPFIGLGADSAGRTLIGVARIDITPDYAVRLSGYGNRRTESEGVEQHIWARALAIGLDDEGPAVIVTVDNCGVPLGVRMEVVNRLARRTKVSHDRLAICSTHTHSAPMLVGVLPNLFSMDIPPDHQAHIDRYTLELTDKLEKVILDALADRKPGRLAYAKGSVGFAKNRRPQPNGPSDHDLPVLTATGPDDRLRAVLFSYACHCTTVTGEFNRICGDWAGYAAEFIERDQPGVTVLAAIGCGADQNPNPRPGFELAQQHGQSVAAEVKRLLGGKFVPLFGNLECRTKTLQLPFDKLPTREELEKQAADKSPNVSYIAKKNLARLDRGERLPTHLPYLVQVWNFGNDLAMTFLAGEVVVDYSVRLKKEFDAPRFWVNGYANDVPCYIPSKRILNEGGYEGGGAMVYYDRPTRFAPEVEEMIIGAVHDLVPPLFLAPPKPVAVAPSPTPAEGVASMRVKLGFKVEVVASEPLIVDPVAIDFGADGRLWVVEMRDYPMGMDGNWKPGGRVKVLEDTDGDGRYDKATVIADGLPFPTGVMAWRDGAMICAAPNILWAEDAGNRADRAGTLRPLFAGFETNNYQARVNGLSYGLDNWVYGANGLLGGVIRGATDTKTVDIRGRDFRMKPDTGEFEPVSGLSQQGRVRDDFGDWFGCDNSHLAWHFPLPDHYLRRNPHVPAPNVRVAIPGGKDKDKDPNQMFPASTLAERFNHPESANRTTSACGIGVYRDNLLGDELTGDLFVCEPVHNLVHRMKLRADGLSFVAERAADEQQSEFFASTDNWSRPVQVSTGPDGALYVVDMYRYIVEHPRWIPPARLAELDVRAGDDKGRIYRIVPADKKLRSVPNLTRLTPLGLVAALDTPNGVVRDLVQRQLVQHPNSAAVPALVSLARSAAVPAVRLQAWCTLEGMGALGEAELVTALADVSPAVRQQAIRLSEPFLNHPGKVAEQCLTLVGDSDLTVRCQLALSLGESTDIRAGKALGQLAVRDGGDVWARAAILSSAVPHAETILASLMQSPGAAPGRIELINQLITTAVASREVNRLGPLFQAVIPVDPAAPAAWQLAAAASLIDALERKNIRLTDISTTADGSLKEAARGLEPVQQTAAKIAADARADVTLREAAIHLLGRGFRAGSQDVPLLLEFARTGSAALQRAALAQLRLQHGPSLASLALQNWRQQPPSVRSQFLDLLLAREEWALPLLEAMEKGVVSSSEIPTASRQRLLKHRNTTIQQRAGKIFAPSEGRREVVTRYQGALALKGNAANGAMVFARNCTPCHAFGGQGFEVGPDLAVWRTKPATDLIVAVLDPSSVIEPRFINYNVETRDGRSFSGVISAETATSVTLAQAGGMRETILRTDLKEIRASSLSLMPEGLEQAIAPQDMADLIAYLQH